LALHHSELRTRYCESDALGHINSVSYFIYLEQARVDFLFDSGIIETLDNWPFIIASIQCDYKKQIFINQSLSVSSDVVTIGTTSFRLGHEVRDRVSNELLAVGKAIIVHYDFQRQKKSPYRTKCVQLCKDISVLEYQIM
jgi:acyl-CoA thioester hydrolase